MGIQRFRMLVLWGLGVLDRNDLGCVHLFLELSGILLGTSYCHYMALNLPQRTETRIQL